MNKTKNKIKDEALKQLFKLKLEQLNEVYYSFNFIHPMSQEIIFLFSHSFEKMYNDGKMLFMLDQVYDEFKTSKSRERLINDMKQWADEKGYDYSLVFE